MDLPPSIGEEIGAESVKGIACLCSPLGEAARGRAAGEEVGDTERQLGEPISGPGVDRF